MTDQNTQRVGWEGTQGYTKVQQRSQKKIQDFMPSLLKHPKSAYELEKKSCLKEYKRGSYLGSTGMLILGLSEPRIQP